MPDTLDNLLERAQALRDMGRSRDAVPLLLRGLAEEPENYELRIALCLAFDDIGETQRALEQADQLVALGPEDARGHRLRSQFLRDLHRPLEALDAAREANRLWPESPSGLDTLAKALMDCSLWAEAEQTAKRLLWLMPEDPAPYVTLGLIALKRESWDDAERWCRAALRVDPACYAAHNNLGNALHRQGRWQEALDCYLAAARLDPQEHAARYNMSLTAGDFYRQPTILFCILTQCLYVMLSLAGVHPLLTALLDYAFVTTAAQILYRRFPLFMLRGQARFRALPNDAQTCVLALCREQWREQHRFLRRTLAFYLVAQTFVRVVFSGMGV